MTPRELTDQQWIDAWNRTAERLVTEHQHLFETEAIVVEKAE